MDWQVGDVALCITPGSEMEGMEVVIMSPAFPKPEKDRLLLALVEKHYAGNTSLVSKSQEFMESKQIPCEFHSY